MYHAKNGKITIGNDTMDYICFGSGSKSLIMIPGLSDGLKTVKNMAYPIAFSYRAFAKDYKVYLFSRRNHLPEAYSSREMAHDIKKAMDILHLLQADILGVSQGGTIAQYLAIDFPQFVRKLVLTVTYPKANDTVKSVIGKWISYAQNNDYENLFIDTAEKTYSESYLKKNRKWFWLLTKINVPKSYNRFITQAKACISHDAVDLLSHIECPTLIIGGTQDKIVTGEASAELSILIKGSQLYLYDNLGHGAYEEAEDFAKRVLEWLG